MLLEKKYFRIRRQIIQKCQFREKIKVVKRQKSLFESDRQLSNFEEILYILYDFCTFIFLCQSVFT